MRKSLLLILLASFFGLTLAAYWSPFGGEYNFFLRTSVYTLAPLLAVVSAIFALKAYGLHFKNLYSRSVLCLALGVAAWAVGESLWSYYDFVAGVDPFPSIADFFYILAYPLFFLALVFPLSTEKISWQKLDPLVLFFLSVAFVLLSFLVIYFGVYLAYQPDLPWIKNTFAIGYGLGDLILLITCLMILLLAWELRKGTLAAPWLYFFCGLIAILVADILFALFGSQYELKLWPYYSVTDSLWVLGYLYLVLSFYEFRCLVQTAQQRILEK